MHFIGIDIGTSKICGIAYNYKNGEVETVYKSNDSTIDSKYDWEKIQNPGRILEIVEEILDKFCSKFFDIKGIGITGQMHGILYVDKNGESLSPLITWQDGCGNLLFREDLSYAGFLSRQTGYHVASGYGLVTHFYNLRNNLVLENAIKICTIMDFIAMKLSGNSSPIMDSSNSASLGFFDLANLKFDTEALKKVGIDPFILPVSARPEERIGYFRNSIPVFPAIGDNQAGFLGSINQSESSLLVNVGTSGQISAFSKRFVKVDNLDTRPFPGGGYILVGASLCGGDSFNILKGLFENTLQTFYGMTLSSEQFFRVANSIDLSKLTNEKLLLVETLFEGTRVNPDKRGSINNISINNLTVRNLIIGFYEGVCTELFNFYVQMPDIIKENNSVLVGSGNAIRRNSLLCRIFENKFDRKLIIPAHHEGAAFGACLNAVVGSKNAATYKEAGRLIEYSEYDSFR